MPTKFDTAQYKSNWDPTEKGTFVSPQDVLAASGGMWQKVWETMLSFIPTQDQINQIVDQSLSNLIADLFPVTKPSPLLAQMQAVTGVDFLTLDADLNTLFTTGNVGPLIQFLFGASTFGSGSTVQPTVVPGLDASKITSGQFAQDMIDNLTTDVQKFGLALFSSANMVLDPTFDHTNMWANAVGAQTTAVAHSGTTSWRLTGIG